MSIESLEHMVKNRVKMFLRHTWLVTILGSIILAATLSLSVYYFTKTTVMRIAAGPAGSANVKFVQVLEDTLVQNKSNIRLQLVATTGAEASAQAMSKHQADAAVLPSSVGSSIDWPAVAILRQNVMAFIVPAPGATPGPAAIESNKTASPSNSATPSAAATPGPKQSQGAKAGNGKSGTKTKTAKSDDNGGGGSDDSDDDSTKLTKVTQLAGKRIGIVTGTEASTALLDVVLNHYGVPLGQVRVSQIAPANVAAAVKANQVDALFIAGAATGAAISNAISAASQNGDAPGFIEIDQADGIAKRNPAFAPVDIDAGTFGGNPPSPDDSLKSLGFAEYLLVNKSFDHNAIAALAKLIYTSRLSLAAAMAGDIKIQAPSTDKDGAVVIAPGALAYLTDNEQDFFDKYGNEIFYGMLIFPVFGSAIAAVASYLRSDSRTRRLRLLQRVLDLVRRVHAAQNLEAIEQLQIDADNLVIAIIHQSEHEEFDETVRMSFSFALDQLRFAIAARRTAILDHMSAGAKAAAAYA